MFPDRSSVIKTLVFVIILTITVNLPVLKELQPFVSIRGASLAVLHPLQSFTFGVSTFFRDFSVSVVTLRNAQAENAELHEKIQMIKSQIYMINALEDENEKLSKALEFRRTAPFSFKLIPARVIARSPQTWNSDITIDKGQKDGVKTGKAVISPLGLVGRVVEVSSSHSKVLLATDPVSSVSVMFPRTDDAGVLKGRGPSEPAVSFIQSNSEVAFGDEVVTSGVSDYFPKGVPVGKVSFVGKRDFDMFESVTVRTSVNYSKLDIVFVVR